MIKEDSIIGKKVIHFKCGSGTVESLENVYLSVKFNDNNVRKFRYPDAFEMFLSIDDESIKLQIEKDLEKRRLESDYTANRKSNDLYKNMKEFEHKKAKEHEAKKQMQIEKQRRAQMMSRQRMQQYKKGV